MDQDPSEAYDLEFDHFEFVKIYKVPTALNELMVPHNHNYYRY